MLNPVRFASDILEELFADINLEKSMKMESMTILYEPMAGLGNP